MNPHNLRIIKIKKGQIWTLDYIIGLLVFIAVILISFTLIRDLKADANRFEKALQESNHISMNLVNPGSPITWNSSNIISIGLCENNRVNLTKLEEYDKLDYNTTKVYLQVSGEYVFYFENRTTIIQQNNKCFRGYYLGDICTLNIPSEADNIAKTERLVILNSSIVKMVIIVWNQN